MGVIPQYPRPDQLPAPGQIVHQEARPDLVQVCTSCGLLVGVGFEERHAARHAEIGDELQM